MKTKFIQLCIVFSVMVGASQANALTDTYYAVGEDLDMLIESDNTYVFQELEYELRKFGLFREVEDYLFNLSDSFLDEDS